VLLVVKNATIPREQVMQTLSGIRSVGANIVGVALNSVISIPWLLQLHRGCLLGHSREGRFPGGGFSGTLQQQK